MIERLATLEKIFLVGHRGYKAGYPENTLLSFRKAIEIGVDVIEFDLRLTQDHLLVIMHDETVDRTTNGSGRVCDYTLADLKKLDAGRWFNETYAGLEIPTLEELCEQLKDSPDVLLNVEIKKGFHTLEAADMAVAVMRKYGYLSRCFFTSFDAEVISHIHDTYQLKTQGFPGEKMANFVPGENGTYSKMWAIGMNIKDLTPDRVKSFRDRGLLVGTFCADTEEQARYAINCGVNRMTCNDPLPAMEVRRGLEERNG